MEKEPNHIPKPKKFEIEEESIVERVDYSALDAESLVNQTIGDNEDASALWSAIREKLEYPENLSPSTIYSLVFTMNHCTFCSVTFERSALADDLRDNFQTGLQAIVKSKGYNQQEYGGLRNELFQGYMEELRILQSLFSDEPPSSSP